MPNEVTFTDTATKQMAKAPARIVVKLMGWAALVRLYGIAVARERKGYRDKPLKGERQGQRSIRLNRQWRAIYQEVGTEIQIHVLEVTPHEY